MEHEEAKGMHAAEKYALGELPEELRDEFEEHYFDCTECAMDVRATVAFVATSKEVFQEEPAFAPVIEERGAKPSHARGWLKALIAVPAIAALILVLIYERHNVTGHGVTGKMGSATVPAAANVSPNLVASASFALRGGDREGGESTTVRVRPGEAFGLQFDFTPGQTFAQYTAALLDQDGHTLQQFPISAERINKEVKLMVPGGLVGPGKYTLLISGSGGTAGGGQAASSEVAKFAFVVENTP